MPVIRVEMFAGRTKDQKRKLSRALTDAFVEAAGGKPESVHLIFTDIDKGNWSVGGELCSDRDEKR